MNGATLAQHIPCVQDGVLEVTCSQCGYTGEARTSMHTDGAWGVQTPPLCLTKGTEVQRCALCQAYLRSREIPATGHTMDKGVTVAPKCEEMGYLLRTCQDCGDEKKSKFVEATGHLSSDWVLTCQPTKRVEGEEQRSCVHCNKLLETRSVAPYTYLIAFETKVTALTGACDTDSYNEIIARLNYYYKLSAEMQAVVREDYEKLCAAIELYNAGAEAHNAKLVQGEVEAQARDSRELLENTEELMEGLWYSLFDKTRERGVTV